MWLKIRKITCAVGVLLAMLLTGCAGGDTKADVNGKADGKEGQKENKEGEGLTITNFHYLISDAFIEAFHEKYPGIDLEITNYSGMNGSGYAQYSLEHGDIPDIYVSTRNFSRESQEKYLLDLSNYDFVNEYSEGLLGAQDVNGAIYLLPCGYQIIGINYNKTILEEHGWKVPQNFREFTALAEEIEAAGLQAVGNGMNLDGYCFSYFFNLGNTVYFSTPEGAEWKEGFPGGEKKAAGNAGLQAAAEYMNKWVEAGLITQDNMERVRFMEGDSVFYLGLGINAYEWTTEDGKHYEYGIMPWLGEDAGDNMLTRSVSRYVGLNRSLAEPGNEKKLAEALQFMEFLSTLEGQQALFANVNDIPTLHENAIGEGSPYWEIADMISGGRTVPLVYEGWEQQLIPISQEIRRLVDGDTDVEGMLEAFDRVNENLLSGTSDDVYGTADSTLSLEKTAELVAVAEGIAVDADCAMISLNGENGSRWGNQYGLGWYLYEGPIDSGMINMIRPVSSSVSVLELTGAQIKAMRDAGFDADGSGRPYEYRLFTAGGMELADETVYRLAVSTGELTAEQQAQAEKTTVSPAQAIQEYVRMLGTVSEDTIGWDTDRVMQNGQNRNKDLTGRQEEAGSEPDRKEPPAGWELTLASEDWGLGFGEPGTQPAGNASAKDLAWYDAWYVGEDTEKVIYLTFDCGYENGNTEPILDALKEHGVPAAFFVVGHYLETAPELVKRMVDEGHTVGNHTYHHPDMSTILDKEAFRKEMDDVAALFREITGTELSPYYRPPQGKCNVENLKMAQELGYRTIFWSLAYVDWDTDKQPSHEEAFDKLTSRVHPGAVVLLHNTSQTNGEILDELLTKWEEMGYTFRPLSELTGR